jgi:hypothetical protein
MTRGNRPVQRQEQVMQSTFQASDTGQAIIQNTSSVDTEQLVFTCHPGGASSVEVQIREDVPGSGLISSAITVNRDSLQKLVQWLREQGVVD